MKHWLIGVKDVYDSLVFCYDTLNNPLIVRATYFFLDFNYFLYSLLLPCWTFGLLSRVGILFLTTVFWGFIHFGI